jgi:hypothetical protein
MASNEKKVLDVAKLAKRTAATRMAKNGVKHMAKVIFQSILLSMNCKI